MGNQRKTLIPSRLKYVTLLSYQKEQREIGKIKLSDNQDIVASLIDNEKLDLRIFVKTDSCTGATKRGLRFYLFDDNWTEFKKLINEADKVYEEIA